MFSLYMSLNPCVQAKKECVFDLYGMDGKRLSQHSLFLKDLLVVLKTSRNPAVMDWIQRNGYELLLQG